MQITVFIYGDIHDLSIAVEDMNTTAESIALKHSH